MGGGMNSTGIYCTLFESKNAPTMIGTKKGEVTESVKHLSALLEAAGLRPLITEKMIAWLLTHYVESTGLLAGVMEAGSGEKYVETSTYIRESILLTREGYRVCMKLGVNPLWVYPQCLYYAPLRLIAAALRKMFKSEASQLMITGHISHSPDEMKQMYYDVLNTGKKLGISLPRFQEDKKSVDDFAI
jgi:hypothetical protein